MKDVTPDETMESNGGTLQLFKKGQSGNPKGKAKGTKSFKVRLREAAERKVDWKDFSGKKKQMAAGEAMINTLFAKAIYKGCTKSAKLIMEYAEDKNVDIAPQMETVTIDADCTPEEAARAYQILLKGGKQE